MIIKWIRCRVEPSRRATFASAQAGWTGARRCAGFLGQVGGWRCHDSGHADIVAFWNDRSSLQTFMTTVHDDILRETRQAETVQTCRTRLLAVQHVVISWQLPLVWAIAQARTLLVLPQGAQARRRARPVLLASTTAPRAAWIGLDPAPQTVIDLKRGAGVSLEPRWSVV